LSFHHRYRPKSAGKNASWRCTAAFFFTLLCIAGCASSIPPNTPPSRTSATPVVARSDVDDLCRRANGDVQFAVPTTDQMLLNTADQRIAAESQLIVAVQALPGASDDEALTAGFLRPLTTEIDQLRPVLAEMESAVAVGNDDTYNALLQNFQGIAEKFEPSINNFLSHNGLTDCILGG
jgi:hypothetical protein